MAASGRKLESFASVAEALYTREHELHAAEDRSHDNGGVGNEPGTPRQFRRLASDGGGHTRANASGARAAASGDRE